MNIVYVVLYNFLFHPLFIFSMFFLSIFNKKIRQGIIGRFESLYILKNYFNKNNLNSNIIWFHCSSLGEYMQAEPLIDSLKINEHLNQKWQLQSLVEQHFLPRQLADFLLNLHKI